MQIQEIQSQLSRQSEEEKEMQKRQEKERQNEQKAQQKYKNWLKKKNQEKMELEQKEKVRWTLISFHEKSLFTGECNEICFVLFFVWTGKSCYEGGAGARTPQEGRREISRMACKSRRKKERLSQNTLFFNK